MTTNTNAPSALPTFPHQVTHEVAYVRQDGSRGAVLCRDRDYHVAYYEGMGYRIDYVSTTAACVACSGEGRRSRKRGMLGAKVRCEACKGEGIRVAGEP